MKVWRKRTPMYVYQKMIIVFLILLMPIYGISLVFNWTSMNHLRDEAERSLAKNVSFYTNQLNEQISFIRNLQLQLIHNSDLQSLAFYAGNISGYEEVALVNRIHESLTTIQNASDYVVNTGIYIKSYKHTLSTEMGTSKLPNPEHNMVQALIEQAGEQPIYAWNDRILFIMTGNRGSIVSYLELSKEKLAETISQITGSYQRAGVFMIDDASRIVVQSESDLAGVTALMKGLPKHGCRLYQWCGRDQRYSGATVGPAHPFVVSAFTRLCGRCGAHRTIASLPLLVRNSGSIIYHRHYCICSIRSSHDTPSSESAGARIPDDGSEQIEGCGPSSRSV